MGLLVAVLDGEAEGGDAPIHEELPAEEERVGDRRVKVGHVDEVPQEAQEPLAQGGEAFQLVEDLQQRGLGPRLAKDGLQRRALRGILHEGEIFLLE